MNSGRLWEFEINASLEQMRNCLKEQLHIPFDRKMTNSEFEKHITKQEVESTWNTLMEYYAVISPEYQRIVEISIKDLPSMVFHLYEFIYEETAILLQTGTVKTGSEHSKSINEKFPVEYSSITTFDPSGNPVETKDDFLISKLYMIRLEKVGEHWAATSVPRRQHHGVISKLSIVNRNSLPYRNQAIRVTGETEVRLLMSVMNPLSVVALLYMANNSELCNFAMRSILESYSPSDIGEIINYAELNKFPSRALERVKHLMYCFGLEFKYRAEDEFKPEDYDIFSLIESTEFQSEGE